MADPGPGSGADPGADPEDNRVNGTALRVIDKSREEITVKFLLDLS
tara:strand:+ start:1203 stop:1340 length:138 start_codon:yes stop_codon:yes gene_type:complete